MLYAGGQTGAISPDVNLDLALPTAWCVLQAFTIHLVSHISGLPKPHPALNHTCDSSTIHLHFAQVFRHSIFQCGRVSCAFLSSRQNLSEILRMLCFAPGASTVPITMCCSGRASELLWDFSVLQRNFCFPWYTLDDGTNFPKNHSENSMVLKRDKIEHLSLELKFRSGMPHPLPLPS